MGDLYKDCPLLSRAHQEPPKSLVLTSTQMMDSDFPSLEVHVVHNELQMWGGKDPTTRPTCITTVTHLTSPRAKESAFASTSPPPSPLLTIECMVSDSVSNSICSPSSHPDFNKLCYLVCLIQ